MFIEKNPSPHNLESAGESLTLQLYVAKNVASINKLHYLRYNKVIRCSSLSTAFRLESLPPTSSALRQHSHRVYHSVQQAMGHSLPALDWGWTSKDGLLKPVLTDKPASPEILLKLVSCGFKSR